jgi:hypothetical protein
VRDIKLEVAGGERRVEVRLTEQRGEVRVAVRTADEHLAGALRENLPTLSTRLAESGYRAETWRPTAEGSTPLRTADTAASTTPQDSNQESGGRGGRHPADDQQQPKAPEPRNQPKKGNPFAWLMSHLQ